MLLIRQPTPETIQEFLDKQRQLGFTYQGVGATHGQPPSGCVVDHTRVRLGSGGHVFATARRALVDWRQLQLGWLSAQPATTPIHQGEVVAVVARSLGLWWLSACRIVYVIDDKGSSTIFGFAYGTLPSHAAAGEERFLVEMRDNGTVWYDVLAFSRPHHPLAFLGYPLLRESAEKRFGRESAAVMQELVDAAARPNHGVTH